MFISVQILFLLHLREAYLVSGFAVGIVWTVIEKKMQPTAPSGPKSGMPGPGQGSINWVRLIYAIKKTTKKKTRNKKKQSSLETAWCLSSTK